MNWSMKQWFEVPNAIIFMIRIQRKRTFSTQNALWRPFLYKIHE